MLKRIFYVLLCLISGVTLYAQEDFEFGEVPEEDLSMKSYSRDMNAEALVLYDKGETSFQIDNQSGELEVIYTRTKRVKVFKKSGLDRSNITISYFRRGSEQDQIVHNIRAFSYTLENGEVQKSALNDDNIFEERANERFHTKRFAIPNVKEGSVFEYQYTIEIPKSIHIPEWQFQTNIPTRYSEYQVSLIPFYEYTYLLQGKSRFDITDSRKGEHKRSYAKVEFEDLIYRFGLKDLPAFTDDSYITSVNDYIIKMDWQLATIHYPSGGKKDFLTTWPKLSNQLLQFENYGKFISSSEKAFKKIKPFLALEGLSDLEKAKRITAHVKSNYRWDGRYRKYTEKTSRKFQDEKIGSTAEINLFLTGLLRAAGFETSPVLISTRDHGKIKTDYPFDSFFNSSVILVNVNSQLYLTEGTEPLLPFGLLPPECINEKGLIVKKNSESWVDLNRSQPSLIQENMTLKLNPGDQSLEGDFFTSLTRYDAMQYKKDPSKIGRDLKDYEIIEGLKTTNEDQLLAPYALNYKASKEMQIHGNRIYLKPFLDKPMSANPLKAATRAYPIDFIYAQQREYNSSIIIPEGYEVMSLPESQFIEDDLFSLEYAIQQEDGQLIVKGSYTLKKSVYQSREYRKLREHLTQLVDKFNEQIVLEKL